MRSVGVAKKGHAMNVRSKVSLAQAINALLVIAVATVAVLVAQRYDYHLKRAELAYDQRQTITMLAVQTFRYKTLIVQSTAASTRASDQFASARADIATSLEQLDRQTAAEFAFVDEDEREAESEEAELIGELAAELQIIDDLSVQLLQLRRSGMNDEASAMRRAIETQFDDRIAVLLATAVAEEQQEVRDTDARVARLAEARVAFLVVTGIVALVLSAACGLILHRNLSQPLQRLLAGVRALKSGDLGHRVQADGKDELAELGAQFNEMAMALSDRERELVRAREHLEHEVGQRTAELAAANDRLRYLDRRRLLFLAEVSHELRTPITVLRGEAEVTLRVDPKSGDGYRQSLTRIAQQAEQMGRLIDDLMFLVRSEADTITFDRQRLDAREVVSDAAHDGAVLGRGKNVTVSTHLSDLPVWVNGDPHRLRQATLIAIDNAVKYCDPGTAVDVRLSDGGGFAVISVRNQGAGIPAEELPYVFERFYRIRQNQDRRAEGTGLGLPIAKWIAEKHGGSIVLSSDPGGATELTITLPLMPTERP